jgi:hypothetical protein
MAEAEESIPVEGNEACLIVETPAIDVPVQAKRPRLALANTLEWYSNGETFPAFFSGRSK